MKNKVPFVGRSNVGKSSTIKALTGMNLRVGKRPGVTRQCKEVPYGRSTLLDMPGFGFMAGLSTSRQEEIKKFVVQFHENSNDLAFAVQVIDIKSFASISDRWISRGYEPVDIEMYHFLKELDLNPLLLANKIDKIPLGKRDGVLDRVADLLGVDESLHNFEIIPYSAKTGESISYLKKVLNLKINQNINQI